MRIVNERAIVLRVVIIGILLGFTYPFLPAKQKWQIRAAFGSDAADSLLSEYYESPVPEALQFSMEHSFRVMAGSRRIVDVNDVRYVKIADRVWGQGRLWAIHLRLDAVDRLRDQVKTQPDMTLTATIDQQYEIPLDIAPTEIGSPIYVDPTCLSSDPYLETTFFEPWYQRPFLPGGTALTFPDYP